MAFLNMGPEVYMLLWFWSCLLLPGHAGQVRFVDTQVITEEGKQFSLKVEHIGTTTDIVNVIVKVDNINQDFVGSSQVAYFPPGGSNVTSVTFTVADDTEPEVEEVYQFSLTVMGNSATVIVPNVATVIISANDDAYGVFSITDQSPMLATEDPVSTNIVNVNVIRTKGLNGQVTVNYQLQSQDAVAMVGTDITPAAGSVTFNNGETVNTIQLQIRTDTIPENDEHFQLALTGATQGARVVNNNFTITIRANDAPLRFQQAEFRFDENPITRINSVTVTRGLDVDGVTKVGSTESVATVSYLLIAGSAQSGKDYHGPGKQNSGQVTFGVGQTVASINLEIIDDTEPEMEEVLQMILSSPTGDVVLVAPNKTSILITSNDNPAGILSLRSPDMVSAPVSQLNEDKDVDTVFTVVRSAGSFGTVSVNWEIVRNDTGSGLVGEDLTPVSGTVTFAEGEREKQIVVKVTQDSAPEPTERFKLRLLAPVSGSAKVEGISEGFILIQDSDNVYGTVEFAADAKQKLVVNALPRMLQLVIARAGSNNGDLHLNISLVYKPSDSSSADVLESSELAVVMMSGEVERTEHVHVKSEAFLQVGGVFTATLRSVKLVTEPQIGAFNSPSLGARTVARVTVTPAEANGEIGFQNLDKLSVVEPDASPLEVRVPLSREGASGQAVIGWTLQGNGTNAASVTSGDVRAMSGSVVMESGSSVTYIVLMILPDDIPELNEEMTLTLTSVDPAGTQRLRAGFTRKSVVIGQNDNPGGVFQFEASEPLTYSIAEGATPKEFTVVRDFGDLLEQSIQYIIINGDQDFFGATNVLTFPAGVKVQRFSVAAMADGIPELEEVFTLRIQSYGASNAVIGQRSSIELQVPKNDNPNGVLQLPKPVVYLNESKGAVKEVATIPVQRSMGMFGGIQVTWSLSPGDDIDLRPSSGFVTFTSDQDMAYITLESVPDEITESAENFTLTLSAPQGGAVLGQNVKCTVLITANDFPIMFETLALRVEEPSETSVVIQREGALNTAVTLKYQTLDGTASSVQGDYSHITAGQVTFSPGEAQKSVTVRVLDDTTPEGPETFFLQVYEIIGDAVFQGPNHVNMTILDNDEAYGTFHFIAPFSQQVDEGSTVTYGISRSGGVFGGVDVLFEIFAVPTNAKALNGGDFMTAQNLSVRFQKGEATQYMQITPRVDNEPENEEIYTIKISSLRVFDGRTDKVLFRISDLDNSAMVTILASNDPNGRFGFPLESKERTIAEDYYPGMASSTQASLRVERRMGTFGTVEVLWEVYSDKVSGTLPPVYDLLFLGTIPSSFMLVPSKKRLGTGTNVVSFTGNSAAYVSVPQMYHPTASDISDGFSISSWIQPFSNTNGYVMAKTNDNGSRHFYSLKLITNSLQTQIVFGYSVTGSNGVWVLENVIENVTYQRNIEDTLWHHLVVSLDKGVIYFYVDTVFVGTRTLPQSQVLIDSRGSLTVGAIYPGSQQFSGYMQDVRIYTNKLTDVEIQELYETPARTDLTTISGYITYLEGLREGRIDLSSLQDTEEEGEEVFTVRLIQAKGGATLSGVDAVATITILKSDNANGLFYFPQPCQPPSPSTEAATITCTVARQRGDDGQVIVTWSVYQLIGSQVTLATQDFVEYTGQVVFAAGERTKDFSVKLLDDSIPEPIETYVIRLMNISTEDNKVGTTNASGASIDPANSNSTVVMTENDFLNGLLQFKPDGVPPLPNDPYIEPMLESPTVRVREESGVARLLVVRAMGYTGEITVEWRTTDGSAKSSGKTPVDYTAAVGRLTMKDQVRYAFINITIVDNSIPEDEKTFVVTLLNPSGGAALGKGSAVIVVIQPSDGAFGVFQFGPNYRGIQVMETGDSGFNVVPIQIERVGGSIGQTVVSWEVTGDKNNDIVDHSGNVTFANQQLTADLGLKVRGDTAPELDELFVVQIIAVTRGELGQFLRSEVTILANDDPYGKFVFPTAMRPVFVNESNQLVAMEIHRLGGSFGAVEVNYITLTPNETFPYIPATVPRADLNDFQTVNGSVRFMAGQEVATFNLQILEDLVPEEDEVVYVRLTGVRLVETAQIRAVDNSPRLGSETDSYGQIIIYSNDNANGELVLTPQSPTVYENQTESFLFVTRFGGAFGEVTVTVKTVDGTALSGVDYILMSNQVTLGRGETKAAVPLRIIDDSLPELAETFTVQLDKVLGGGVLGTTISTNVVINTSDDPNGAFEFTTDGMSVEEPDTGPLAVNLTIVRTGGTLGVMTLEWVAMLGGGVAQEDVSPSSGSVFFVSNEGSRQVTISVLPDNIPEGQEDVKIQLTKVSEGGRIGARGMFTLSILANDNPHGSVQLAQTQYSVSELDTNSLQNIRVTRSGGSFGELRVYYSTGSVSLLQDINTNIGDASVFQYFRTPILGGRGITGTDVTVTPGQNTSLVCAKACLQQMSCKSFEIHVSVETNTCTLHDTTTSSPMNITSTNMKYYEKDSTKAGELTGVHATPGEDYSVVTNGYILLAEGTTEGQLPVTILADSVPELDEKFMVMLTRVDVTGAPPSPQNSPYLGGLRNATVTILANDSPYGAFTVYSDSPLATEGGHMVQVEERPNYAVDLIVERQGGSMGEVSVQWSVDVSNSTAVYNVDYRADGATLTYLPGETRKLISITILDDTMPELMKTVIVRLSNVQGGATIKNSNATIQILENDNVAGVLSLSSSSVQAKEGDTVGLKVLRNPSQFGTVNVDWEIRGLNGLDPSKGFRTYQGSMQFAPGESEKTIQLEALSDNIPEVNEEYQLHLVNMRTTGVGTSGAASLDPILRTASVTIQGSNNPHGVLQFSSNSLNVRVSEASNTVRIQLDRKFGAIGAIRVEYEITNGSVSLPTSELVYATPNTDFVAEKKFIDFANGVSSAAINVTIMDDETPEVDEVFVVRLLSVVLINQQSSGEPPVLGSSGIVSQVIVNANDGTKGVVIFKQDSATVQVDETSRNISLTVVRDRGTFGEVSVFFFAQSLIEGTNLGLDYKITPQELVFLHGDTTRQIQIEIVNDDIPEPDEIFEIVLSNPTNGLVLGVPSRATVTILANDDPAGFVYLESVDLITLDEPSKTESLVSKVDVTIGRGPGIYGVVHVPFEIVPEIASNRNDLTPMQGTITLDNKQMSAVLTLTVLDDERPEDVERFTLRLLAPDNAAQLGTKTARTIIINSNDSPNGLFSLYAAGTRLREVSVEEGVGMLQFDIVRTQGLEGRVTVDMVTEPGTADTTADVASVQLVPVQVLPTTYVENWYSYTVNSTTYLLMMKPTVVGEMTSDLGSQGSAGPVDMATLFHTTLFRWQGELVPLQTVETDGVSGATAFRIDTVDYLVVSNKGNYNRYLTQSRLYRVNPSGNLTLIQKLDTKGATDVAYFTKNTLHYIVIANSMDNAGNTRVNSDIWRWEPGNKQFGKVSSLLTLGASAVEVVNINENLYLVVANQYDSVDKTYTVDSKVYKFDSNAQFSQHQSLATLGVADVRHIRVRSLDLLIIANNRDNTVSSPQKSDVYRWDITTQMFVLHERLETTRVEQVEIFTAFDDTVYAMFSNSIGSSAIFGWDVQNSRFQAVWSGRPALSMVPITVGQGAGNMNLIAVADKNITTNPVLYQLIKVKDSDFAPRVVTMTMDAGQDLLHASVYVFQDTTPEDTETFYVTLRSPGGGAEISVNNKIAVNILSNDNAHGVIEIAADSLEIQTQELAGRDNTVQVNVIRRYGYFGHVTVRWIVTGDHDGTNDITPLEGIVEFATGQAVATVSLTVRDDDIAELQEVTYLRLTEVIQSGTSLQGRGAAIGVNNTAKVVVLANDSPYGVVRWETTSQTVVEPEGSDTTIVLYVVREQGMSGILQVTYITSVDDTIPTSQQAVSGQDFISRQGMALLQENVTRAPVEIVIKQDTIPEAAELFLVNLTSVVLLGNSPSPGAAPSIRYPGNTVMVTISENDNARGIVQFNVTTNIEGRIDIYEEFGMNTTVPLTVSRSVGLYGPVTVTWQAEPREATVLDFSPSSGTLSLANLQQSANIYVTIIDDNIPENMETFDISLISVTGGALLGPSKSVRVAILKNDSPNGLFRFVTSEVVVKESRTETDRDGEARLIVERVQGSEGVVNVQWRLNAEAVYDFYEPLLGTMMFAQGEKTKSLSLRTKPDSILEGEERFRVSLVAVDNNADISHTQGDARIIVLPDPGASGTIEIVPESRLVYIGEPGESSPNYKGQVQIVLTRGSGIYGDVSVSWAITPRDQSAFLQVEGTVTIVDLQQKAAITLQALDDSIPELRSIYTLQLSSATGGAVLSSVSSATTSDIVFVASDHPHGEYVFDLPETFITTEDRFSVSLPVIRRGGLNGQVFVTYKTYPGTATELDYFPEEGTLTFQHGQNQLFIDIQLRQDDVPEGPESFYLNLTSARLVDPSSYNYTLVSGLQLDQRPVIGSQGVKEMVIERNDNAEGTIQFTDLAMQFTVTEEEGVAKIPLIRTGGNYGAVSVLYRVINVTATVGEDYVSTQGEVTFADGSRNATLDITILDDSSMENTETFRVELVSTTGGAVLGKAAVSTVTIAKSDYPNGKFGFKGQLIITVDNPARTLQRMFTIERTSGLLGEQTVFWQIFGPNNPTSPLLGTNDISYVVGSNELTSGTLKWADGEAGERTFTLNVKPFSSWEIEKTFVVKITKVEGSPVTSGNGEVSPTTGAVLLTISKFGDPNGIVRFDGPAQLAREYEEPDGVTTLAVQFPIIRRQDTGTVGNIEVFWEVQGPIDRARSDMQPINGSVLLADEERSAAITLQIMPDTIPELSETFRLAITKIVGGAEIDKQYNLSTFTIKYNDDPHGVFGIIPEYQTVKVNPVDLTRNVRLNFTRYAGVFGNVILTFSIKYDIPQSGILLALNDGTVTFAEGLTNRILDIKIEGTGFLEIGTTFSVSLIEVNYLGEGVTRLPQFRAGETEVKVRVPAEAANSHVGFKYTMVGVDEATSTCRLNVQRVGTYGTVNVSWTSGFPGGKVLAGFTEGKILPPSGTIALAHGIEERNFTVELSAKLGVSELFAVHLPSAPSTMVPGGARLLPDRSLVRIEPYGLIRFSTNSTQPSVSEMFGKIYLQVERVYGSEGRLEVQYRAEGVNASQYDFTTLENHAVVMEPGQTAGLIMIDIVQDYLPEEAEIFHVNLTHVEKFPTDTSPSISPRISYLRATSVVTILESNDPYGVLNMEPVTVTVNEAYQDINITVKRTGGIFGTVSVLVRTVGGGEDWTGQIVPRPGASGNNTITEVLGNRDRFTSATGGSDYVVLDTKVEFKQNELAKNVTLTLLADDMAEPAETVLVYLTQPTGGARIAQGEPDGGKKGFTIVTVSENDLSNGVIGFSQDSLTVSANEDTNSVVTLKLARTDAFFGEVEISWLAKVSANSAETEDVILASQLEKTAGTAMCPGRKDVCYFNITLVNDNLPEEEHSFVVKLTSVKNDAKLHQDRLTARVNVAASDHIRGLIQFTEDSRTIIASNIESSVRLKVSRTMGQDYRVEVGYRSLQMTSQLSLDGVMVYPALEGEDYAGKSGILVFEAGRQDLQYVDISLTPFQASSNPYPKQFYLDLRNPTNGASINVNASRATILLVDSKDVAIWDIVKNLPTRPLNDQQIKDTLGQLDAAIQVSNKFTENEVSLSEDILEKIIEEGLERKLTPAIINQILSILCKFLTPDKDDATRGRFKLAEIMENTAYLMVTGAPCPTPLPPDVMTLQCVHAKIVAARWPLNKIQGYQYPGRRQDTFTVPGAIPNARTNENSTCADFHFIEYDSEQWFQKSAERQLLSNKIISFGLKGRPSSYSDIPAVYRIHSPDRRIATRQAECVYFDTSLRTWVSPREICQVTNDLDLGLDDYVDCSCKHLTHYAVKATTSDPGLVGYSTWFFISCFICMTGLLLAILAHHVCSVSAMFSASLLMHMCFAAMATQICYVVAAYLSTDEILVYTLQENNYRCIVMGLFLHYFFLCQFSWMVTQAFNFWKILIMNDEHTERKYVIFFLLGWGFPVVIVAVFYVVTFNVYKYVYDLPLGFIYGDVNNNGDMCFVTNAYAGLAGVVLPVLLMLVVVAVVFVKAFQVTPQWQAYDDIYRGRYNITEMRMLLLFWGTIIITWLWGGLHLVYGQLWMLVLFAIFNIIQGLMALVLYAVLRNPCIASCITPQRASSYSMTGHLFDPALPQGGAGSPGGQYQFHPSTLDVGSLKGSRASLLNESWERDSQPSRATRSTMKVKRTLPQSGNLYIEPPIYRQNTISDTKDFDDLLYALKTGGSFSPSDLDSMNSDKPSDSSSIDKYELRRIDIADTHL